MIDSRHIIAREQAREYAYRQQERAFAAELQVERVGEPSKLAIQEWQRANPEAEVNWPPAPVIRSPEEIAAYELECWEREMDRGRTYYRELCRQRDLKEACGF